jgi:hypothetical protein
MIRALTQCVKFVKEPTNAIGFRNVIILRGNHLHISATHVAIFRVVITTVQIQL